MWLVALPKIGSSLFVSTPVTIHIHHSFASYRRNTFNGQEGKVCVRALKLRSERILLQARHRSSEPETLSFKARSSFPGPSPLGSGSNQIYAESNSTLPLSPTRSCWHTPPSLEARLATNALSQVSVWPLHSLISRSRSHVLSAVAKRSPFIALPTLTLSSLPATPVQNDAPLAS